jgi:hypothetical protein
MPLNGTSIGVLLSLIILATCFALMLATPTNLAFSQLAYSSNNNTTEEPLVQFLTDDEAKQFINEMSYKIITISNSTLTNMTLGDANNVKASTVGNTTYVAWQGNINNTNHVFISITYDGGANYTKPVQLTPTNANASELQIFASDKNVSLVWFDYNQTSGKSSIFGSRSTDGGQQFTTYRLTFLDTNATNLMISTHNVVLWTQESKCGGGDGPPPPPPDNNLPTSIAQPPEASIKVGAISPGMPPDVVCGHWW